MRLPWSWAPPRPDSLEFECHEIKKVEGKNTLRKEKKVIRCFRDSDSSAIITSQPRPSLPLGLGLNQQLDDLCLPPGRRPPKWRSARAVHNTQILAFQQASNKLLKPEIRHDMQPREVARASFRVLIQISLNIRKPVQPPQLNDSSYFPSSPFREEAARRDFWRKHRI